MAKRSFSILRPGADYLYRLRTPRRVHAGRAALICGLLTGLLLVLWNALDSWGGVR